MLTLSLSWTVNGALGRKGGKKQSPDWSEIQLLIESVMRESGTVTLETLSESEEGCRTLQVRAEHGRSIITLGEIVHDDYDVRSFRNQHTDSARVDILGDFWDGRMICRDVQTVVAAFREFYESGNVSRDLLN